MWSVHTQQRRKGDGLTNLMADHRILLLVREHGLQDGQRIRILHLAKAVRKLMLEKGAFIREAWTADEYLPPLHSECLNA